MTSLRKNVWKTLNHKEAKALYAYAERYKIFLDEAKTEREAAQYIAKAATQAGFIPYEKKPLQAGEKVFLLYKEKAVVLLIKGKKPLTEGIRVVGAHIDAPRLDLKPQPLYEDGKIALLKTHYYGGIKKYQWTTIPLALHGVVFTLDGKKIDIRIGDKPGDPVFYITDLLPHLGRKQMEKTMQEGITGEALNVVCGHAPLGHCKEDLSEPIKARVLDYLEKTYGITEDDLTLAELELVPAANAQDVGFDRSMIAAHGHDDRSCAFAALDAILGLSDPEETTVALFVDKEEIGSVGNTSMSAAFFENFLADLLAHDHENVDMALRKTLSHMHVLSADVTAAFDPTYPEVMDAKNSAYLGYGPCLSKYTGARGKSGSNDANAEYLLSLRQIFHHHNVPWQIGELGKIDEGGGGTIAYILANRGAEVVDMGVPVLSMHAPIELVSKADVYATSKAYRAFLLGINHD